MDESNAVPLRDRPELYSQNPTELNMMDESNAVPLRDRPERCLDTHTSDTLLIYGLPGSVEDDVCLQMFSVFETPVEWDLSFRHKAGENRVYAKFSSKTIAHRTLLSFFSVEEGHPQFNLNVQFELGLNEITRTRIICRHKHNTPIRAVKEIYHKNQNNRKKGPRAKPKPQTTLTPNPKPKPSQGRSEKERKALLEQELYQRRKMLKTVANKYTQKSFRVDQMEYPFPYGLYLKKTIKLLTEFYQCSANNRCGNNEPSNNPLLDLLSNTRPKTYTKEVSEAWGMVDAMERAMKVCLCVDIPHASARGLYINVFVIGDGNTPFGASLACLYVNSLIRDTGTGLGLGLNWRFHSIDPLMQPIDVSNSVYKDQLIQFTGLSQEYPVQDLYTVDHLSKVSNLASLSRGSRISNMDGISIVIACHSHAPIEEFWERIPTKVPCIDNQGNRGEFSLPKLCITMECCFKHFTDIYGLRLNPVPNPNTNPDTDPEPSTNAYPDTSLVLEFCDFEIYSPMRNIKIYASGLPPIL